MKIKEVQLQLSLWLIPTEADSNQLKQQMDQLSRQFNAPFFIPHITVFSTLLPLDQVEKAKDELKVITQDVKPFTLDVLGIGCEDNLFQSLFLNLQDKDELRRIYEQVKVILGRYGSYNLNPHLSLVYKQFDAKTKQAIIKRIEVPKSVTFDKLGVIVHLNQQTRMDINNWRVEVL